MTIDPGSAADGVRGTGRPPYTAQRRGLIIVAILIGIGGIVALSGLLGGKHRTEKTPERITSGMPYSAPTEAKPAAVVAPRPVPAAAPAIPSLRPATVTPPGKDQALEAPIFATAGTGYDGPNANARLAETPPKDKDDEFTATMTASSVGAAAKAKRMKHPSLTIPAGIVIPCILQTAINSELAGFVDCVIPVEVRSADGTVTLFDKGTQVLGQIKSGLRRGQDRLFILWTRARTPENITVDLASPAADEVGRAGVPGDVNTHFWKMFGTAALFSLIEYGPAIATSALQNINKGNNSFTSNTNFLSPQQSLANTILQDDLHIPPTLEKNQGETVSIFVARDLSFADVYTLRATR